MFDDPNLVSNCQKHEKLGIKIYLFFASWTTVQKLLLSLMCVCACACTCVSACMHTCMMYACVRVPFACTPCAYVHACMSMYVWACVCIAPVCMHVYMHVYMHL